MDHLESLKAENAETPEIKCVECGNASECNYSIEEGWICDSCHNSFLHGEDREAILEEEIVDEREEIIFKEIGSYNSAEEYLNR